MRPVGEDNQDDEAAVGYEQARRLRATMVAAGIDRPRLWLYYFGVGGDVSEFELDAYLHHSMLLPRLQRDLLAQAANEILADLAPPQAPYAADLADDHTSLGRDRAATEHSSPVQGCDVPDHDDPGPPGR
ncbi:hypothetical protein [Kocuria sp. CCUG 69068]|uniref:hypothetical protein n=1 Tax=Kocuria sp. CCUG 69068 TaxID=2043138 RepID=UPI001E5830C9